jgi:glycosyltransferase involved in cell wall biosynthesis
VSGLLTDVGDVAAMADAAIAILADEQELQRFREGAARQASRFDLEQVLPRYEALYEQVRAQVQA